MTDWHVNEGLAPLIAEVRDLYPGIVIGTIGDTAHQAQGSGSDHNPNQYGRVNAADFMLGDAFTKADGDDLVAQLLADGRTKYVIWQRRIWLNPNGHTDGGWHDYTGSDPHTDHVHESVWDSAHLDTRPWNLEILTMTLDELMGADVVPNPYPSAQATNNPTITVANALKGGASADAKCDILGHKLDALTALVEQLLSK